MRDEMDAFAVIILGTVAAVLIYYLGSINEGLGRIATALERRKKADDGSTDIS